MPEFDLGIDSRMIRHTGIGTYLRGLLGGFEELGGGLPLKTALFGGKHSAAAGLGVHPFEAPIYSLLEQARYPALLSRCRLWHAPHYNIPLLKRRKTRLVVTIHDLIHWIFRGRFFGLHHAAYAGTMLRQAVRKADHIIAVSEHTKRDLVTHFKAKPEDVTVIHEAVHASFKPAGSEDITRVLGRYGIPESYFFYVGSLKPHKNLQWLIPLFRELRAQGKLKAKLVILGRKDRKYPRGYEMLASVATDADLHYLPAIEEGELQALYSGAIALVHPSLYEGFGLTPLEAMACGTAVIASSNASIPEICGDGACLVDSSCNQDIMQAMIRAENDESFRRKLQERGKNRVKSFSWTETARKTLQVYQRVLGTS